MKQVVMTAPGAIEIHEITPPKPGNGEVLLRIKRIGVCGSDVHVYHGKHPYTNYPVVQGHEFFGLVEELGGGVTGLKPGDQVTSLPQISCGKCDPCKRGDYHICETLKVQGFQAPGCAQELWVTDAKKIVRLPNSFTFDQGALVEPLSVAVHAVRRAGKLAGKRVAIFGVGPIGNLVAQVAQSEGAKVIVTDLSDYRLQIAKKCGIEFISNAATETFQVAVERNFNSRNVNVAFECVGVEQTVNTAIMSLEKGGTLIIVGVFGSKPIVEIGLVQDRELNILGTLMYQRSDYEKAIDLIASGKVKTEPLVSIHFPLDKYLQAYKFIDEQGDRVMKVIIDVAG
jgi:L-iditol 2-dehydrogenase